MALLASFGLGLSLNVSAEQNLIPSWIKNTAKFWVNGQIGDQEFIQALQYLVEKDILKIPPKDQDPVDRLPVDAEKPNSRSNDSVQNSMFSGVTCHRVTDNYVVIDGKFTNNDNQSYQKIYLIGALLDEKENVLATQSGLVTIEFIEPYQTKIFNISIRWSGDYAICHVELDYKK